MLRYRVTENYGNVPADLVGITGVYAIIHEPSERTYIGHSNDIGTRLRHHFVALRGNRHHSRYLQNVWNMYPESDFLFTILEETLITDCVAIEQKYMDMLPKKVKLNSAPAAKSNKGFKLTSEARVARKLKCNTPEFKEKLRQANLGKVQSRQHLVNKSRGLGFKPIVLSDGQIFETLKDFNEACGYASTGSSTMLRLGHSYDYIAKLRGVLNNVK